MLLHLDFLRGLKKPGNIIDRIFVFYGPEEFLKKQALKALKGKNQEITVIWADEVEESELEKRLLSPSFFSSGNVFYIKRAEELKNVRSILKNFSPVQNDSKLILDIHDENRALKNWLNRNLKKIRPEKLGETLEKNLDNIRAVYFPVLTGPANEKIFVNWIKRELLKAGLTFDHGILAYLREVLPKELELADKELKKIILYFQDREITKNELETLLVKGVEHNLYLLIEQLFKGDKRGFLKSFKSIIWSTETPYLTQAIFSRMLKEIIQTKLGTETQKPSFIKKTYRKIANSFTLKDLLEMARVVSKNEALLKSKSLNSKLIVEKELYTLLWQISYSLSH